MGPPFQNERSKKKKIKEKNLKRVQSSWNSTLFSFYRYCHIARLFYVCLISNDFSCSVLLVIVPIFGSYSPVAWWWWWQWRWWWWWCSIRRPKMRAKRHNSISFEGINYFFLSLRLCSSKIYWNRSAEYLNTCTRDGETMAGRPEFVWLHLHTAKQAGRQATERANDDEKRIIVLGIQTKMFRKNRGLAFCIWMCSATRLWTTFNFDDGISVGTDKMRMRKWTKKKHISYKKRRAQGIQRIRVCIREWASEKACGFIRNFPFAYLVWFKRTEHQEYTISNGKQNKCMRSPKTRNKYIPFQEYLYAHTHIVSMIWFANGKRRNQATQNH